MTPGTLSAQAVPAVAPPTREEITQPVAPAAPPTAPRLRVEGDIERAACPLADPAYADLRVTITSANFNNLKGVTPEELRPAYAPYLGQDRPVSVICDVRDAAATILRRKGYLAAVQVPTQRIEGGVVNFEVLYAKIVAVRVRGDAGRAEGLIASYLEKLTDDAVFNRFEAERYLLLARDLPGYDVRLSLRPAGTGAGDLIGDVTVTRIPFEADLNIQNYAARDTGRFGGQLRGQAYGLTGLGDRTTAAFYSTFDPSEQKILQLGHDFRAGPEGLTLGGRFTYAWTRPDIGGANPPNIRARTLFATAEASYPFVRSQGANLRGAVGMDFVNQTVRFNGTPLSRDRLRVAFLRIDADATDIQNPVPGWRLSGSAELRQGLDILDARQGFSNGVGTSRLDGKRAGTLVRFAGLGEFQLAPNISFSLAPRAQYAFDALLSFEEYSAGTYTIGRGYDPGTIIGDSGVGVAAEIKVNRIVPNANLPLALQPFGFVDSAWVWNRNNPGVNDPQRLTSVGGGVRASYDNRFRIDLTVAVPTKRAGFQIDRGDVRVLLSVTTKLWPWGAR